jgi:hypothetical protein
VKEVRGRGLMIAVGIRIRNGTINLPQASEEARSHSVGVWCLCGAQCIGSLCDTSRVANRALLASPTCQRSGPGGTRCLAFPRRFLAEIKAPNLLHRNSIGYLQRHLRSESTSGLNVQS